ncbi:MAG: NapC/NirT family cytochrome c [Desulfobacterales bacterium]|nr:NapC/NirT family cytochrome c [Desulfobacterales bacterium]
MQKTIKTATVITLTLLVASSLFVLIQYAMVRTSTPQFCATCHEMEFAYDTWKSSSHFNNRHGLVAECMDCHLPPVEDTLSFYPAKIYHGIKDLVLHFTNEAYDREKSRKLVYETFNNKYCLKCHSNLLYIPDKRGAMLAHRSLIYARSGYEKKCLDCHENLVHKPTEFYLYK